MAGEVRIGYRTGQNLYFTWQIVPTGTYWNGAAFEAFNAANWTSYDLALAEVGVTGDYAGDVPAGLVSTNRYRAQVRLRAGGAPAVSDVVLGEEERSGADWLRAPNVDTFSLDEALRLILAGVQGITEGVGTDTETFFAPDDATERLVVTIDEATGNRTAVTRTAA
jgi:hypothetical protein